MQSRCAVQEYRVVLYDLFQDVPDFGPFPLDELLRTLHGLHVTLVFELLDYEGLEELESHALGQAALVDLKLRAHHDHRSARVVDPLAQEVLAEPPLFALEHVA